MPDFLVTPIVSPNTRLRVGSVVTVGLVVRNKERVRRSGEANFVLSGNEGAWKIIKPPKGGHSDGQVCGDRPPGHENFCGDTGWSGIPFTLRPGERRAITLMIRLDAFRCPGGGDYIQEFYLGIVGPVKHGAAGYRVAAWFENDAQDYANAVAASTPRPSLQAPTCRPESVDD